jgi:DNA-binding response OmpR family regulator
VPLARAHILLPKGDIRAGLTLREEVGVPLEFIMEHFMKIILVVDDEKDIVQLIRYNLEQEGFKVEAASDGIEALKKANEVKPDLILLDIMLPGKDGYEVMKSLNQNERTANIPVIFLTAKSAEFDEVLGLELGADDYVVKPISLKEQEPKAEKILTLVIY